MQKYNVGVWGKTQGFFVDLFGKRNLNSEEQSRCTNIIMETDDDNVYRSTTRGFCVDALAVSLIVLLAS